MGNYIERECPACGEKERRSEKGLCRECRQLIKEAKMQREWIEGNRDELATYRLPSSYYNLPYVPHTPVRSKDPLEKAFTELLKILGEPVTTDHTWNFVVEGTKDSYSGQPVAMTPRMRDLLNTIWHEIINISRLAYNEGYKDGSNMIGRLASGSLSIDDFNRITIGK